MEVQAGIEIRHQPRDDTLIRAQSPFGVLEQFFRRVGWSVIGQSGPGKP